MPGYGLPGYDFIHLVAEPLRKYTCSQCKMLLRSPVQLNDCGHWICWTCLLSSNNKCFCPGCEEYVKRDEKGSYFHQDKFVQREIDKAVVACPVCQHILKIPDLEGHIVSHFLACRCCQNCGQDVPAFVYIAHRNQCLNLLQYDNTCFVVNGYGVEEFGSFCGRNELVPGRGSFINKVPCRVYSNIIQPIIQQQCVQRIIRPLEEIVGQGVVRPLEDRFQHVMAQYASSLWHLLSPCSNNGVLLWKIPNYRYLFREAKNNKFVFLLSRPFYTSNGYKLRLQLYLNGDGEGLGTHLSLYLLMVAGENDGTLQWPFRFQAKLELINVNTDNLHVPYSFTATMKRSHSDGVSITSHCGCPEFIPHTDVESLDYIYSDSLFIKCKVDPM